VVLLGHRDEDEGYPPDLLDLSRTVMRSIDLAEARRTGMKKAVLNSFDRLRRNGAEGVWILDGRIAGGFVETLAGVFRRARERGTQ
jgi:hypothetical protein